MHKICVDGNANLEIYGDAIPKIPIASTEISLSPSLSLSFSLSLSPLSRAAVDSSDYARLSFHFRKFEQKSKKFVSRR
jgi:hypothetical protein